MVGIVKQLRQRLKPHPKASDNKGNELGIILVYLVELRDKDSPLRLAVDVNPEGVSNSLDGGRGRCFWLVPVVPDGHFGFERAGGVSVQRIALN